MNEIGCIYHAGATDAERAEEQLIVALTHPDLGVRYIAYNYLIRKDSAAYNFDRVQSGLDAFGKDPANAPLF